MRRRGLCLKYTEEKCSSATDEAFFSNSFLLAAVKSSLCSSARVAASFSTVPTKEASARKWEVIECDHHHQIFLKKEEVIV